MSKRKFPHLWAGEAGDYGNDESRADLALCSILARHSENSDQIDRLFRQSGLMREKWDSKRGASTYGRQTIKKALAGARACRPSRPTIILNKRQIDEVVNSSISALQQNSSRPIYVRGGALCEVRTDERGEVSVEELSVERLLGRLGECADWQAVDKKGKPTAKFPPTYLARVIAAKGDWPFPPLRGLSFGPYFRPDGSLVKEPGYDQASERYLHLRAPLGLGDIPESPSPAEVAEAVSVLDELLCDFPFADVASRASAFALLIQPCVRDVIDEVSPLALFDSPTPGSGKGLLCRCCSLIHTGVEPSFSPPPTEESEWKKTILSILLSGCPSIIFDNVEQLVKSASLCAVLTARSFSDRLLGKNLFLRCPNDTLWHITGNNIGVAPDLARRSFWIRLLPLTDRPQTRTDFLHPNLVSWVTENRSRILRAILILVRSWFAAGRPRPADPPIGGYVRWSNVIGGILEIAGIAGFLSNSDALWEEVNSESVAWIGFLEAWGNVWGSDPVTVKDLLETLEDMEDTFNGCVPDAVADALHGTTSTSKVSRLGKALTKMRDRRFGPHGFHLVKCRRGSRGAEWKVSADDASRIVAAKDVEFEALLSVPEADFTPMADDFDYVAQEEKKNDIVADLDAILAEIEDPL